MPEPVLTVALDSIVPVYRQIVDQVRLHIASGSLAAGAALPSVRGLSLQLGVHHNTVAEAYRQLADEGLLDRGPGRRAVVLGVQRAAPLPRDVSDGFRQRLRALIAEMRLKGVSNRTIERDVAAILQEVSS